MPLPLVVHDVDHGAGLEGLRGDLLAERVLGGVGGADLGDVTTRRDAGLLEVALERLRDLARVDLAVGELHGGVASASDVRTCVTTFVPTATTVTGTRRPASSQSCVIPSFVPSTAVTGRAFCWGVVMMSSSLRA